MYCQSLKIIFINWIALIIILNKRELYDCWGGTRVEQLRWVANVLFTDNFTLSNFTIFVFHYVNMWKGGDSCESSVYQTHTIWTYQSRCICIIHGTSEEKANNLQP